MITPSPQAKYCCIVHTVVSCVWLQSRQNLNSEIQICWCQNQPMSIMTLWIMQRTLKDISSTLLLSPLPPPPPPPPQLPLLLLLLLLLLPILLILCSRRRLRCRHVSCGAYKHGNSNIYSLAFGDYNKARITVLLRGIQGWLVKECCTKCMNLNSIIMLPLDKLIQQNLNYRPNQFLFVIVLYLQYT